MNQAICDEFMGKTEVEGGDIEGTHSKVSCHLRCPNVPGEYAYVDLANKVVVDNYNTGQLWSRRISADWATLDYGSHPRHLAVCQPQTVRLYDIRAKTKAVLLDVKSAEKFLLRDDHLGLVHHTRGPYFLLTTAHHLLLCDERFPGMPVSCQPSAILTYNATLWYGIQVMSWRHMLEFPPQVCHEVQLSRTEQSVVLLCSQSPAEAALFTYQPQGNKLWVQSLAPPQHVDSPASGASQVLENLQPRLHMSHTGGVIVPHNMSSGFSVLLQSSLGDVFSQHFSVQGSNNHQPHPLPASWSALDPEDPFYVPVDISCRKLSKKLENQRLLFKPPPGMEVFEVDHQALWREEENPVHILTDCRLSNPTSECNKKFKMEKSKKLRTWLRSSVTKNINEIETEFDKEYPSRDSILVVFKLLEINVGRLRSTNSQIGELMLDDENTTVQELEKEQDMVEQYERNFLLIEKRVAEYLDPKGNDQQGQGDVASIGSSPERSASCRLPKIALKVYDGTSLEWLGWWSQFEAIHENPNLSEVDKFQYLIQSMKVIEALRDRFGDKVILTEVLPEELIRIWQRSAMADYDRDEKELIPSVDQRLTSLLAFVRREDQTEREMTSPKNPPAPIDAPEVEFAGMHVRTAIPKALLATTLIRIVNPHGNGVVVRALLDQGSQSSFIQRDLLQHLSVPTCGVNVDVILGADVYGRLLLPNLRFCDKTHLCAQNTRLGWVISGELPKGDRTSPHLVYNIRVKYEDHLDELIQRFWEVEEIPSRPTESEEDEFCRNLYKREDCFGNSLDLCVKRQMALERRLVLNDQLRRDYYKFMEEYEGLGHMTQLTEIPVGDQSCPQIREWRYVPTGDNPADIASRGILGSALRQSSIWWTGPTWLSAESTEWPRKLHVFENQSQTELLSVHAISETPFLVAIGAMSSTFTGYIRKVAWILRFCHNCRYGAERYQSHLTTAELRNAHRRILQSIQFQHFREDIRSLTTLGSVKRTSKIYGLTPFLDDQGILRVGGRLKWAPSMTYEQKRPALLPSSGQVAQMIVQAVHMRTLHGSVHLMLSTMRQKYWMLRAKDQVKRCIRECVTCCRYNRVTQGQLMSDLPKERLTPGKPFSISGVDYAGPVSLRLSKGRGRKTEKGYICLFVCFVTRAVHLELVTDASTPTFMLAFKRFVARRGHCTRLYSDQGTNFVGAARQLRSCFYLAQNQLKELAAVLANDGTEWRFNPPGAPHFGGLWEAGVKALKYHMRRIIGSNLLTYEELLTVLVQIESLLIKEERMPPARWLMGRVVETHPGKDGLVRVVSVRKSIGVLRRPLVKLVLLPVAPQNLDVTHQLGEECWKEEKEEEYFDNSSKDRKDLLLKFLKMGNIYAQTETTDTPHMIPELDPDNELHQRILPAWEMDYVPSPPRLPNSSTWLTLDKTNQSPNTTQWSPDRTQWSPDKTLLSSDLTHFSSSMTPISSCKTPIPFSKAQLSSKRIAHSPDGNALSFKRIAHSPDRTALSSKRIAHSPDRTALSSKRIAQSPDRTALSSKRIAHSPGRTVFSSNITPFPSNMTRISSANRSQTPPGMIMDVLTPIITIDEDDDNIDSLKCHQEKVEDEHDSYISSFDF
ncbi:hypothetical protein LAZ67_1003547 [Cordylochernes scorpioides]|uniref:Pro-Pol polyprotein n=1 Tax=Cordylochernes scorpioides TaxID=51811 RepID=A0ABY6JZR4_9ARAC|nr:hypothetical protein LAZ67_1003547 [Cordylochernes scorpioides]